MQSDTLSVLLKYQSRFNNKTTDVTPGYLQSLAQRIDDLFNNFESLHSEILQKIHELEISETDIPYIHDNCYFEFSEQYFTFKGKLMDILSQSSVTSHPLSSTFVAPSGRADTTIGIDAKLPKISLPKFSGDYMEWIPFRDIYVSLVHNNESLAKIQKFYYLKGTLVGEAASLIKTISATEANYESAWSTLESRYHNKRMIVGHLITTIFNIEKSDGGFQSIKTILDSTKECLSSLKNLGVSTSSWDPLLIHIIAQKLDFQTRKDWEQSLKSSTEIPTRMEMFEFLERTFRTLESLQNNFPATSLQKIIKTNKYVSQSKGTYVHAGKFEKSTTQSNCSYCDKNHSLSKCFIFLALPLLEKNEFLSAKGVCRNCLAIGHNINHCTSPFRCIICKQQHHTVLHSDGHGNVGSNLNTLPSSSGSTSGTSSDVTSHSASSVRSVLLYTIRLFVKTDLGHIPLRALLDPGSQGSLITESAVQILGIKKQRSHCRVIGIGDGHNNLSKFSVILDLFSRVGKPVVSCTALVLSTLSSYTPDPSSRFISLPDITIESLADPYFYKSDRIDLILGSDICSKIKIPSESFVHGDLFFQNTYFGWVFSGSTTTMSSNRIHIHNTNLETILKSFWEQEEVCLEREMSNQEVECESYFKATTKRTESGRYMVQLPFKSILYNSKLPELNNNAVSAFKRWRQLEISFLNRPFFAENYKAFMLEYETLGHMSKIGAYPQDIRPNSYILPHHGVIKEDSSTTKLRVVFDGSSKINGNTSLNEELCSGPALQNDLPAVMTQWRRHKIAFSADIEKMFRQIQVIPEHRRFQQILWRFDPLDEISIYELNTVTYGTASAPYLAIRVLQQLAYDYQSIYPQASKVLLSDSYVDDILSGADSLEDVITLHRDLCTLLSKGGCNLRKWITPSKDLLKEIPEEFRDPALTLDFDRGNTVKTLGIQWNTKDDCFSFKGNSSDKSSITKRSILSEAASLYDPLGWLTPSTVIAKSLFKSLWELGLDWDEDLPDKIKNQWLKYRDALPNLENLKIPRWIEWSKGSKIYLHCFCDASTTAFAAVVYSRIESVQGISVNILQAKSKVSPIKIITIPRLELCAAALLVSLTERVKKALNNLHIEEIVYWSDSSTVLSWIKKPPSNWNVYVANRVAQIQRSSKSHNWRYVPSALNPADCASRGIMPNDLANDKTWWHGPAFLHKHPSLWPSNLPNLCTSEEQRKIKLSSNNLNTLAYPEILSKFSKLQTLLRVTALCLRFAHNCKNPINKNSKPLMLSEINESLDNYIKLTQKVDFPDIFAKLSKKCEISNCPILKLMPFLDENGIIRVGGRLQNSSLTYNVKHPILLAKSNPLSRLIILDSHEKTLHGGVTLTMSYVNRKFWIISGNQVAKSIVQRCVTCFKYAAKTSQQIMGNLPHVRLNVSRPFKHSGVDYAGPITIKTSSLRSSSTTKGYICLFVCMVTKAIHLEAVSNLTTNAFLAAFRRFVSRRGACTDLYSDCGTNFVGASKELQVLYNRSKSSLPEDLQHALGVNGTNWHFIPPASPHFGGLWEAGVKSTKYHLKRITKDRVLNFEELTTLLCQIESCLNSRPLAPLSADPSNFDALTPAHFLIGEPTNCIQEESLLDNKIDHLTRWKCVEKLKQHFWKRWRSEYLNRLQARPKWLRPKSIAKVGDLVLIADDRCGPGQWLLGRIHETHPGADGHIRVVSVLTKNKIIKRPITKISFLPGTDPLESNNSSSSET